MNTSVKIGIGISAGVVALGAAVGVGALAAGMSMDSDPGRQQAGYGQNGQGGPGGREGRERGGMDTTKLASALATKLNVDQAKVEAALKEVMTSNRPSDRPSAMPTAQPSQAPGEGRGQRADFLKSMAASLADKLDLDEAKVLTALQEAWQDQGGAGAPSGEPTR